MLCKYLLIGLAQGFLVGLTWLPNVSFVSSNLQFAMKEPGIVDALLKKEVKKGFLISPYDKTPFPITHVNPIGIATHKYESKKTPNH